MILHSTEWRRQVVSVSRSDNELTWSYDYCSHEDQYLRHSSLKVIY